MTQAALFLDLDCSADDAGQFLYEAEAAEPRCLALGTLLDLVASAFNMSAAPEPIAFDVRVAQLGVGALNSLRLELNPATGAFAVHVEPRDQPRRYQTVASGQRFSPTTWPDGTSEALGGVAESSAFMDALRDDVPATFGRLRGAHSWPNGVVLQLSVTPAAREECARFSLHPAAFGVALRAAKLAVRQPAAQVRSIGRVAILGHGAVPDGIAVTVDRDDASASDTVCATLFDASGRVIAELSGISFEVGTAFASTRRPALSGERLAKLAAEALGREVPHDANLLTLGLSSLDLVRLVAAVYGESRVQVSLEAFLGDPTLQHLHALTLGAAESSGPDLAERLEQLVAGSPLPSAEPGPLTSMQQALWLASLKPSAAPAYVECAAWRVHGTLDIEAMKRAWLGLQHFESLRSAIIEDSGRFAQCVLSPDAALSCESAELALDRESAIETWLRGALQRGFIAGERLARMAVLRVADDDHVLLLAAHHAICDGSSFAEHVLPEFAERYGRATQQREAPSVRSSAQPRHLAQWELDPACAPVLAAEALRWANELSEVDESELHGDRPRSPRSTQPGRRQTFALSADLSERLEAFARREGHSQFAVGLALFGALLYRFAGLRDLLVGVPVAQRFAPSLTLAAGCLINFAPLRLRLAGQITLRALVRNAADEVGRLLQRQRVPFQHVAKRLSEPGQAGAANPRIGFSYEASWPALQLAGLELERLEPELTHAKLDLFLRLESSPGGVRGLFEYDADLFDSQTIATLAKRYVGLLERLVEAPDARVMDLPWLSIEEQTALLAATRGPALPGAKPLPALFTAHLQAAPDVIAVTDGTSALSYATLDARAAALGQALRDAGVQRGECVVLYLESCVDWPVAVFGTWRAGAAIVPIDASQPRARQTHMFAIAEARVAICHTRHCAELASFGVLTLGLEDALSGSAANQTRASPDDWGGVRPDDLAFGIFTSGSTGLPKLALGNHGGLANKALAQLATFRLEPGVRVLQFASPAFDAALSELVLALSAGGTLCVPAREARYSGDELAAVMQSERIEVAMLTPSVVATLPQLELPRLRLLLVVGERCPAELVDHWSVGRDLYNLYGPTETTIWATSEHCQPNRGDPSIGKAIPNAWVYVLDRDLNLLGQGQVGEICIGGAAVGSGYKHASDSDRARFVSDPYASVSNARMYRTGDRGHFLPDGRLVFVGRDDDQIKLLGRRIALGEIESALRDLAGVQAAVVVVHEQGTARARLSAFVQTHSDDLSSTELRSHLRAVLPSPMIPTSIAIVESWPRLISGKIDRKALALRAPQQLASGALTSAAERAIATAFSRVLGIDPGSIGPDDDFFGLGGRSLDIVLLAEELARVGVTLSVVELLQAGRVSELATLIEPDTSRITLLGRQN